MELVLLIILLGIAAMAVIVPLLIFSRIYIHDEKQQEHSILRNYPLLGKARYIIEKAGPELRQYLFNNDNEGRPFHRREFKFVYKAGKYNDRMLGYGSERNFEEDGFYISNHMFPKQREEMKIDQEPEIKTKL